MCETMTTDKYYKKEKCSHKGNSYPEDCENCKGKGFTRGVDITELIEFMLKMGAEHIVQSLITNNLIEAVEE